MRNRGVVLVAWDFAIWGSRLATERERENKLKLKTINTIDSLTLPLARVINLPYFMALLTLNLLLKMNIAIYIHLLYSIFTYLKFFHANIR